jgi:hypothetical protein
MLRVNILCAALLSTTIQSPQWADLPAPAQTLASQLGIHAANFTETLTAIDLRTAERLREGEFDHLVYYMLQSRTFIPAEPIEPARSAAEYVSHHRIPAAVETRIVAFARSLARPANERQAYFSTLLANADAPAAIRLEYARAMTFLYRKEVECRSAPNPQTCVASIYSDRGLSSDTSPQSMEAVRAGLAWLKQNRPRARLRRVLIVGPGVDFAPRTALREDGPPRVYQPAEIARLLDPENVDCADINPRVLLFAKSSCRAAYQMNIATRTIAGSGYDLIIATNILLYLDDRELLLALNNIRAMLKPGGILLHNDNRFAAQLFGKACALPVIHFGEVTLDSRRNPPLTDRFVLHGL